MFAAYSGLRNDKRVPPVSADVISGAGSRADLLGKTNHAVGKLLAEKVFTDTRQSNFWAQGIDMIPWRQFAFGHTTTGKDFWQ
jgi:hypothetical protein